MTEQDIELIVRLWENGESARTIAKLLPYKEYLIKREIVDLRQKGILKGQSGRSATKTWAKVLQAYNNGTTNTYDLSEMFGLKVSTINKILSHSHLNRKRPQHNYKKKAICEKTNKIIKEINLNKPLNQVAMKYGVSRQYVHQIKNKIKGVAK